MTENSSGLSPREYLRAIKNFNIDPTYTSALWALLWAADEIERLENECARWKSFKESITA